jgi:hypothetical protein
MFERWDAEDFLNEIDADQFDRWKAFASVEPFGPFAEDQRSGMVLAMTANLNRDKDKRKDPFTAADFMLSKTRKPEKKLSWKLQRERMEAYLGKPKATS